MLKAKMKFWSVLLCLTLLMGLVPMQAFADSTSYVTREQAVAGIIQTVGLGALNETESDLSAFKDASLVTPDNKDELAVALTNGILTGYGNGTISPSKNVTRLEFALFLSRTIRELPAINMVTAFKDVPAAYQGDVAKIAKAGLMGGYGNEKFGSGDYMTAQQMAAVLGRVKALASVRPQDDFFYAMNRNWLATTKLPAGYPGLSAFDEADRSNSDKLKLMVQELYKNKGTYAEGTKEQKMSDFYTTILDTDSRKKEGIQPIKKYMDLIESAKTCQELLKVMVQFENETGMNMLFTFGPSPDMKDSSKYCLYAGGLSTGLPSSYLLAGNAQIDSLYTGFMAQLLALSGLGEADAAKKAQTVFAFEKELAKSTMTNEQASKVENLYNPTSVEDLIKMFPKVSLKDYLNDLGYGKQTTAIVTDISLMKKTGEVMNDENLDTLKAYARVHLIMNTGSLLSKDFQDAITAFNSTFLGINSTMSDDERAFSMLSSIMSGYLGKMYVEKYFSAEAKKDVEDIVSDIIATYEKRIEKLDWMSASTKAAAIQKLKTMKIKIGYPDTWNDPLKGITIKTYANGGSLLGNVFAITAAQNAYAKTLMDKPVDKTSWIMPPQTVNAYYSAMNNEIVFPAGILQQPFYDLKATREQNLGGIGMIIAHEITHAFDNNGAQFDEKGNMSNWWTQSDFATFQQKCQKVVSLFDGLYIAPNAVLNGNLTVSENVSDIGAMACILDIAKTMPNANYKQLFESNASIWRFTGTNQMYQLLATQDVHSPNVFRVNRVLVNFQEFYDTYQIKPGDALYLAPENRVTVW